MVTESAREIDVSVISDTREWTVPTWVTNTCAHFEVCSPRNTRNVSAFPDSMDCTARRGNVLKIVTIEDRAVQIVSATAAKDSQDMLAS